MNEIYTTHIQDASDGSGDGILTFPPELLEKMGWKEGTVLEMDLVDENTLVFKEKSVA